MRKASREMDAAFAQAILHTYADIAGISEDEAMNIAGAFGGGMGNMEGTCGALHQHSHTQSTNNCLYLQQRNLFVI
jgi:hypothetical protein